MSTADNKLMRRRLANAYLSSVISISLVLLLVGVAAMLLVNAKSVSDYFKENMQVTVMMKQDVSDEAALEFQTALDGERFIKKTTFVSKEQGQRELADILGDDFLDVFETSPIPVSIDVTLKADYVSADSLEMVKNEMARSPLVDEVAYQSSLVDALNANLSKISAVLGIFIALLLFVGIPLPGTGAWTGALISIILGLKLRKCILPITLGVVTAGAIMLTLSVTAKGLFELLV